MDWFRILISRCSAIFRRTSLDRVLDEELHTHIALAIEDNRGR